VSFKITINYRDDGGRIPAETLAEKIKEYLIKEGISPDLVMVEFVTVV
jgi:hypothetical protein